MLKLRPFSPEFVHIKYRDSGHYEKIRINSEFGVISKGEKNKIEIVIKAKEDWDRIFFAILPILFNVNVKCLSLKIYSSKNKMFYSHRSKRLGEIKLKSTIA